MVVRVVQITDTHMFATTDTCLKGVNTYESLARVVEEIKARVNDYDFVALTGDISQDETADSYRNLTTLLTLLEKKIFYIPGNHDNRKSMNSVLGEFDCFESVRTYDSGSWKFIYLDSKLDEKVEGKLDDNELCALGEILEANPNKHICIFLHHNPANLEPTRTDSAMLTNAPEFFKIISGHKNVRSVVSGHVHQEHLAKRQEVCLISTPSTCVQFKPSPDGVTIDDKFPGFRVLEFQENGDLETRVERVPIPEIQI